MQCERGAVGARQNLFLATTKRPGRAHVSVVSEVRADRMEAGATPSPGTFFSAIRMARNPIMGGLLAFSVPRPHDAVWRLILERKLERKRCCYEAGSCSVQDFGRRIRAFCKAARRKSPRRAEAPCTKEILAPDKAGSAGWRWRVIPCGAAGSLIGFYLRLRTALIAQRNPTSWRWH